MVVRSWYIDPVFLMYGMVSCSRTEVYLAGVSRAHIPMSLSYSTYGGKLGVLHNAHSYDQGNCTCNMLNSKDNVLNL